MPEETTPSDELRAPGLLVPGRNCWRIERARRVGFFVDAAAYFRAARSAMARAQRSVFILSWDINSRMRLVPEGARDGYPEPLGDFLNTLVARRKGLRVYILNWDFAMVYALDREWLPVYKLDWQTHPRLTFRMDAVHPVGASHHQKIVVVDDALAFVGGLDMTRCRWDTPRHAAAEALRCDADGRGYPPFHDVQAMVDGDAARALGELARERWRRGTGRRARVRAAHGSDPWPHHVAPDLADVDVAIARTEPKFEEYDGVQEIRQLYEDAIASAQHYLYFENQYFTSQIVVDALERRLHAPLGPDVVVVSRLTESGWLEELTMGVLRARQHARLKAADEAGRYRMYWPTIPGLNASRLNVHSKVMAVDDRLLSVGSANLNNRSMVLDTECNLVIEARGETRVREAIRAFRDRLLAEHLAVAPHRVSEEIDRRGSLIRAIEALRGGGRSLQPLEPAVAPEVDALIPDHVLIDPEKPIAPDELVAQFVPAESGGRAARRIVRLGTLALVLGLLAIVWRWTPLRDFANLGSMVALAEHLREAPLAPLAVIGAYLVAGVLVLPITAVNAVTGIVFGPLVGWLYGITGSLVSAAFTYAVGRWLGRDTVHRLAGARINRLSRRVAKRGIIAMTILRLLPVAPFTVVNVMAGASHLRLRDFLIGSFLGMAPGIFINVIFMHHLANAVRNPSAGALTVLAVVAGVLLGLSVAVRRHLGKQDNMAGAPQQA